MLPTILFSLISVATGQADWNQCYYDKDAVAPPDLLPCLNETAAGSNRASWCCFAGDTCLDRACFNYTTGNVYQYGCNDPTYQDENCPKKCRLDLGKSPWVGLVQCDDDDNDSPDRYWACNHPDTCGKNCPADDSNTVQATQSVWPFTIQRLPPLDNRCKDMGASPLAMYAPSKIPDRGSVPTTATNTEGKPEATRIPTRVSGAGSSGTATATSEPEEDGPALGAGAIAGIAVGSTVGTLAVLAAIFFMWRRRRRPKLHPQQDGSSQLPPTTQPPGTTSPAPYHYDKQNIMYPNSPSTNSDGAGIQRPVSDMSMSTASPGPVGSPRPHGSPYYHQGAYSSQGGYQPQGPYGTHSELSDGSRIMYEMPAINERTERSEMP
ncbi:hypothetical protein CPLU01_13684 [Colletotrichum plurivorum]|uniref:Uncharacterized protein n=1 Tax=Colletotrichum plurivorum TaxID=2175906 RepID=A0A8H6JQB5_9PEZI|nr:hypothetical protein CPLU01_13684 [Colletotrichum plurivorum]